MKDSVLRALAERFLVFEQRAKELQSTIAPAKLFFGLIGVELDFESFELIPNLLRIRRVTNPPGVVHIASASDKQLSDWMGISRYAALISAEVAIGTDEAARDINSDNKLLTDLAWHALALLKLTGSWLLRCPASSTVSWDVVAAYKDQSVSFTMLDDFPNAAQVLGQGRRLTTADAKWVAENYARAFELRNQSSSQRFGLAFNIAYTCNHASDPRIAMASIWCALDALFGKNESQLSKKLCERIAGFLQQTTYAEVRMLYDFRCDAVHGRLLDPKSMSDGLRKSYALLRHSLIRAIESGKPTLPDWS